MQAVYTLADLQAGRPLRDDPAGAIRLGVMGDPVEHSRSPAMQNAALEECELRTRYVRLRIVPNELAAALDICGKLGFAGVNLTVPHKVAGFSLVQETDAFARRVGAINTVRFADGKRIGVNTDGPGFARAITESFGVDLRDLRVLVLGAGGGAGQAVAGQCAIAGCPTIFLVNRDFAKAEALAGRWAGNPVQPLPWTDDSLGEAAAQSDLIVHATPLGLQPNDPSPLPRALLRPCHLVYDLNYQPTALLAAARATGARSASGLTMLLHQGALAFEFWFGHPAPLAAMRRALGL
ncbi:MAG: shikimate dehydrogenase [Chthoniobacterales bacterium]|nr:shikimate dehydrogenase [Chthoniobacterales bacterium]